MQRTARCQKNTQANQTSPQITFTVPLDVGNCPLLVYRTAGNFFLAKIALDCWKEHPPMWEKERMLTSCRRAEEEGDGLSFHKTKQNVPGMQEEKVFYQPS